jgi:hypothetical protein
MAAIPPGEHARFKAQRYPKTSIFDGGDQTTGQHPAGPESNSSNSLLLQDSITCAELDDRLRALEKSAWQQFVAIFKTLSFAPPPVRFEKMLDESVLPTLHHIGLDGPVARVIFEMALSSWKLIHPLDGKIIAFHPKIENEIEEVRQGLNVKACKGGDGLPGNGHGFENAIAGTINDDVSPTNLIALFDEISTSWIILPRATRFLEKCHCHYLKAYLKTIDRETNELCRRQFGRITVEFLGNYALKFADAHYPKQKLTQLLFYGYAALFWKNLRRPPEILANSGAFNSFFNWIKRLARESEFLGIEENKITEHMLKLKTLLFPSPNFNSRPKRKQPRSSRFLITLRHGGMGASTTLKYFGIDQFLTTGQGHDRFMSPSIQQDALCLLRSIQSHYKSESPRTQMYFRQFTGHLKSAYTLMQPCFQRSQTKFWNQIFRNMGILF